MIEPSADVLLLLRMHSNSATAIEKGGRCSFVRSLHCAPVGANSCKKYVNASKFPQGNLHKQRQNQLLTANTLVSLNYKYDNKGKHTDNRRFRRSSINKSVKIFFRFITKHVTDFVAENYLPVNTSDELG